MAQNLIAGSAEDEIGGAHTPFLESAAPMPQLNHLRSLSQRQAAYDVGGVVQKDALGSGEVTDGFDAVAIILTQPNAGLSK